MGLSAMVLLIPIAALCPSDNPWGPHRRPQPVVQYFRRHIAACRRIVDCHELLLCAIHYAVMCR
jgi:hypothetical protein